MYDPRGRLFSRLCLIDDMGNCLSLSEDPDMQIWSWVDANVDVVECDRCHKRASKPWGGLTTSEKSKDWRVVVLQHADAMLARGASDHGGERAGGMGRGGGRGGDASERVGQRGHHGASSSPRSQGQGGQGERPTGGDDMSRQQSTPFLIMCTACSLAYQREMDQFKKERQYYANAKGMLYPKQRLRTALRRIHTGEQWENTESFHATYRPASLLEGLGEEEALGGQGLEAVDTMLSGEADVTLVEEGTIDFEEILEGQGGVEGEDGEDGEDGER